MKEIIEALEKLGWTYTEKIWNDGTVMSYKFRRDDAMIGDAYWEISIEDHHDERDSDDWLIYTSYHDPKLRDWYGHQIDIDCAVEYEVMKLIVKFVDILESERKE